MAAWSSRARAITAASRARAITTTSIIATITSTAGATAASTTIAAAMTGSPAAPRALEVKHRKQKYRVVIGCAATCAVVVGPRAVKAAVERVLHDQLHVLPRQIVCLHDPPIAVRLARSAAHRRCGVQQRIGTAGGGEVCEGESHERPQQEGPVG